ncbi:MAG: chemotaxis protein CheX [Calditrichaeota bacterium]|nr:chemotaxis protein CheX [Calditrichota bacterium]
MIPSNNSVAYALKNAVTYTFANLAFIYIERYKIVPIIKKFACHDTVAMIDIEYPFRGSIGLVLEKKLTDEILTVVNMNNSIDDINAILAEMANTIAGQFMSPLVEAGDQFKFSLPHYTTIKAENSELAVNKRSVILEFSTESRKLYSFFEPTQIEEAAIN